MRRLLGGGTYLRPALTTGNRVFVKFVNENAGPGALQNDKLAKVYNVVPVIRIETSFTLSKSQTSLIKKNSISSYAIMEFHNTQDVGYHSGQGLGIIYPKETKKALVMDKSEAHLEKQENQVSSTYQEKLKSQQSKQTKIFAMNMKDLEKHFFFFNLAKFVMRFQMN